MKAGKMWGMILLFCLAVIAVFFAGRGYSNLASVAIYVAILILFVGLAFILTVVLLDRAWAKGAVKTLILCLFCNRCLSITPANQAPEYVGDEEVPKDDLADFKKEHAHVRRASSLVYLTVVLGPWGNKGSAFDPVRDELLLARGGGRFFLVNRSRSNIWQPLDYKVFPLWRLKTFVWLARRAFKGRRFCGNVGN